MKVRYALQLEALQAVLAKHTFHTCLRHIQPFQNRSSCRVRRVCEAYQIAKAAGFWEVLGGMADAHLLYL